MASKKCTNLQPVDTGWSWMVCCGGSIIRFLLNGFWTSLGLFFIHWEREFNMSASSVSIIGSIIMCQWFMGPLVSALSHSFTHRAITFFSGILVGVSFMVGSQFASEIWHLYLMSAIAAFGLGCSWQISIVHVTFYFKEKLGLALGITTGFAASGTLVLPPLMQMFLETWGWRGALLLLSAIMFNITAVSLLFRPVIVEEPHKSLEENTNKNTNSKLIQIAVKFAKSVHIDMFLKSFPFWVTCFLGLANGMAISPMFVYIAPHAIQYNISEFKASLLIVVMGITSLATRFSSGIVVDKKILSSWKFYSICVTICGASCLLITFHCDYWYLLMISCLFGASNGGIESLYVLVFVHLVGKDNISASYAWGNTMWATGGVISIYLGGFLYDTTGSYKPVFYIAGLILLCAAVLTLSTRQFNRCCNGRQRVMDNKYESIQKLNYNYNDAKQSKV